MNISFLNWRDMKYETFTSIATRLITPVRSLYLQEHIRKIKKYKLNPSVHFHDRRVRLGICF